MLYIKCFLFIALLILKPSLDALEQSKLERRAAVDVGSGGTKLAIADIDPATNHIVNIIYDASYPVPYQASLDRSEDGTFDEETKQQGIKTFKLIKEISDQYQVKRIVAVATSAFRKANNSKQFVADIKRETQIDVQIIPQREEGEIAYFSALAKGEYDPKEVLVWDIGTGSLQITTDNGNNGLAVYMGEQMGSVAFQSYIIEVIQDQDLNEVTSPNPIDDNDLKEADKYARAFARKAFPLIKQKIKNKAAVLGIGRLFYNSVRPLAAEGDVITRKGLRKYIYNALNKTDEQLNNPFAKVDVTNCILTLAIMKALHIQEIKAVDTTSTRGILVYPDYW